MPHQNCLTNNVENSLEQTDTSYNLILKKNSYKKSLYDRILDWTKEMDHSFYTIDLADVLQKVHLWETKMPHIKPFYAVKTNSDPVLLKLLVHLGFSFDCASQGEIKMVMEAGGNPKNIIFAHVVKTPSSIEYASSVGVELMTFDSQQELLKIRKHYPEAKLLLRLAPEDVKCAFDLSDKFGCPTDEAEELLTVAKNLNLNVLGVSFHVGGLCKNPNSYRATIQASRNVFDQAKHLGYSFSILDIGGGFSGATGTYQLFDEMTNSIKTAITEHFPESRIEVIAEPGTFFIASAVTLTTAICGKKEKKKNNDVDPVERYYYLNDGIYGSFFVGTKEYGIKAKPLLSDEELSRRSVHTSRLWGIPTL